MKEKSNTLNQILGSGSRKMRQVLFPPFGFEFSEFGLQGPALALFLAFFDFGKKTFFR